jgi:hypothetical protein
MTHDELVERVARALYEAGTWEGAWSSIIDVDADIVRDQATAALAAVYEAIKEPTSTVIRDGVSHRLSTSIGGDNRWPEDTAALYRAMLAASPLNPEAGE